MLACVVEQFIDDPVDRAADRVLLQNHRLRLNASFGLVKLGTQNQQVIVYQPNFLSRDARRALLGCSRGLIGLCPAKVLSGCVEHILGLIVPALRN